MLRLPLQLTLLSLSHSSLPRASPPPPPPRTDADSRAPGNKADYFYRREFTFTLEGEVFVRYLCFRDAEGFADAVLKRLPERIEIGPVYTDKPDRNKTASKDSFKPIERELIVRGRRRPLSRALARTIARARPTRSLARASSRARSLTCALARARALRRPPRAVRH